MRRLLSPRAIWVSTVISREVRWAGRLTGSATNSAAGPCSVVVVVSCMRYHWVSSVAKKRIEATPIEEGTGQAAQFVGVDRRSGG